MKDLGLVGDIINLILRYFSEAPILIFLLIVLNQYLTFPIDNDTGETLVRREEGRRVGVRGTGRPRCWEERVERAPASGSPTSAPSPYSTPSCSLGGADRQPASHSEHSTLQLLRIKINTQNILSLRKLAVTYDC